MTLKDIAKLFPFPVIFMCQITEVRKMKKFARIIALLLALTLLTACGGTSAPATNEAPKTDAPAAAAPAAEDTSIILAQSSEVANLNPMIQPRTPDSNVQCLIFSFLVMPDENLNYVGDLAKDWAISGDGTVYTFNLRNDVKWHDGEAFTADDVIFTLTSLAHPNYHGGNDGRVMTIVGAPEYQAGTADSVAGLKKIDDYTVEITLSQPNAAFLGNMYTAMLPEHILGDVDPGTWDNHDFNRAPVGNGKYKFVEWKAGQYITLERNEDYFGTKPSIKNVTVQFGADTTLVAALMNGEVDVLYNLPASEIENVEAMPNSSVYTYEQMTVSYIGLNQLVPALSDRNVREALAHAIYKQTLVDTCFGEGLAFVCEDVFPSNHWSHSENVTVYEYNPELSKKLLEESGYTMGSNGYYEKDGQVLHLTFDMASSSADSKAMAALLQQFFKAVGVSMEVIEQDFSTLAFTKLLPGNATEETTAEDFQMYTLGFGVEADPEEYNDYFSTSTGAGSWNFIHYSNAKVDELFDAQLLMSDPAERTAAFNEIAELISQDIPWIPLFNKAGVTGLSSKVQNYSADFRGAFFQIEKWNVAE